MLEHLEHVRISLEYYEFNEKYKAFGIRSKYITYEARTQRTKQNKCKSMMGSNEHFGFGETKF